MNDLVQFQSKLGHQFADSELLTQALTHRSMGKPNNERLEFLGDSVLGYFIAYVLYDKFPNNPEGDLTKMRANLVRKSTLAEIARNLGMSELLIMGGGEMKSGGFNRESVLSDAFESVIGAVYLDGGVHEVQAILLDIYSEFLEKIKPEGLKDSKTRLQEYLQKHNLPLPQYDVLEEKGKAHELIFVVQCRVSGSDETFVASGSSRKLAEQKSAFEAFQYLTESKT